MPNPKGRFFRNKNGFGVIFVIIILLAVFEKSFAYDCPDNLSCSGNLICSSGGYSSCECCGSCPDGVNGVSNREGVPLNVLTNVTIFCCPDNGGWIDDLSVSPACSTTNISNGTSTTCSGGKDYCGDSWGNGTTITCNAGYYKKDSGCSSCPSGGTSAAGSTSVTQCYADPSSGTDTTGSWQYDQTCYYSN
jgi:hypothetical protein